MGGDEREKTDLKAIWMEESANWKLGEWQRKNEG